MCVRSPRKRRSCVLVVAAVLALWHPSPAAALDPATAPHDSNAQRRSLLQAYVVRPLLREASSRCARRVHRSRSEV